MADWTVQILVGGKEQVSTVTGDDLASATAAAIALAGKGMLVGIAIVDQLAVQREAGIAKLVSLGLTAGEAMAVAGISTS